MTLTGGHLNKRKEVPQKHPSSKTMKKAKLSSSRFVKGAQATSDSDSQPTLPSTSKQGFQPASVAQPFGMATSQAQPTSQATSQA